MRQLRLRGVVAHADGKQHYIQIFGLQRTGQLHAVSFLARDSTEPRDHVTTINVHFRTTARTRSRSRANVCMS
jgi:hypothetical protein